MAKLRLELNLKGRVQGVFFRRFLQSKAQGFPIAGLARNEPDGSLTVIIEGAQETVFAFLPFVLEGPPRAEVKEVILKRKKPTGLQGFHIE